MANNTVYIEIDTASVRCADCDEYLPTAAGEFTWMQDQLPPKRQVYPGCGEKIEQWRVEIGACGITRIGGGGNVG